MKLKFHVDTFYAGQLVFEAGGIYEVSEEAGWANRWIKRGAEHVLTGDIKGVSSVQSPKIKTAVEKPKKSSETKSVPSSGKGPSPVAQKGSQEAPKPPMKPAEAVSDKEL